MDYPVSSSTQFITADILPYLVFNQWKDKEHLTHGFTTRLGGASVGDIGTLNLGFNRGDDHQVVLSNYERVGEALGVTIEQMVLSKQVHETNIVEVTAEDKGNGIVSPNKWESVDGLYTAEKGITLVTHYADCVPLFFYAPKYGMIGMAHAGWRGTVQEIGKKMVHTWETVHHIPLEAIQVGIGPSIGPCCFEVHEDVAAAFLQQFGDAPFISKSKIPNKYHINLWECNELVLINSGIKVENIYRADICTCCHSDLFFSHRKTQGKRGTLGAFMALK